MTLRLVVEASPLPQPMAEMRHEAGELVIGRGAGCGWRIEDAQMYVSRRHCVVSGRDGIYSVTDVSREGLFIDDDAQPLGPGATAPLADGMRLRLGDVVIRVRMEPKSDRRGAATEPGAAAGIVPERDPFFDIPPVAPAPPRPRDLPSLFEETPESWPGQRRQDAPPLFDDAFTLDPVPTPVRESGQPRAASPKPPADPFADFDLQPHEAPSSAPHPDGRSRETAVDRPDPGATWPGPQQDRGWPQALPERPAPETGSDRMPRREPEMSRDRPAPPQPEPAPASQGDGQKALAAFFHGLGLPPPATDPTAQEMEALGRRFRMLSEGLVQLLHTRAREKNSLRVAVTLHGPSDVNPLKALAGPGEALAALVSHRGPGYLDPDQAIAGAFRDLADHQMRSWTALQSSLRRMIDHFDPAIFEAEVETGGLLAALRTGGRSARLWQLYSERYRELARAAEDRFLGEIGADFRSAYEDNGGGRE